MANWKIQDIAPPRKRGQAKGTPLKEEEAPRGSRKRRSPLFWLKLVVLPFLAAALLGVGALHFFFARAQVTVWPQTREILVTESITAQIGRETLDKEGRIVPARTLSTEKKATRLFEASSRTVKVNKASGTIRVFNAADTLPKTLVAQTRFVSEEGKLFRTPVKITVPGGTMQGGKLVPGYVDIEVAAAEAGADYNIGPSNFSLPGLSGFALFTSIYAESFEPMTGGLEREVSVVSEMDIAEAKDALTAELTQKAKEELLSQVPEGMVAGEGSIAVEVQEAASLVQAGAELDQFNVSVSLEAVAYLFPKADIDSLVDSLLASQLEERERVATKKTAVGFRQIFLNEGGNTAALDLEVKTVAYLHMDVTELKLKLRGKSEEEALAQLSLLDAFERTELSFWPFWISSVPGSVDKLSVEVLVD